MKDHSYPPDVNIEPVFKQHYSQPPSMAVVSAMADALHQPATKIESLSNWTDPVALDSLFENTPEAISGPTVTFEYIGCRVTVSPDSLQIEPLTGDDHD
ncbi:HalOD1 output domain-containing protein [Haladaptatus pallidirubidus]|uniref:Halobacterial output domain-containing protein n=1 Tax=Haladaptatus pallidirubidus TaxID=1008152 RepID=A0AAV3UIQ8_9EURY|nr:HalOD1 output domain-containing protein [Haladaptatus pallidirubidus]